MLPFFLFSRKGISVLIRAVMVAALKLDGDYCCCSVAAEMENEKKKSAFLCSTQKRERAREKGKEKKKSDERWFSASIIFVTVYEYLRR